MDRVVTARTRHPRLIGAPDGKNPAVRYAGATLSHRRDTVCRISLHLGRTASPRPRFPPADVGGDSAASGCRTRPMEAGTGQVWCVRSGPGCLQGAFRPRSLWRDARHRLGPSHRIPGPQQRSSSVAAQSRRCDRCGGHRSRHAGPSASLGGPGRHGRGPPRQPDPFAETRAKPSAQPVPVLEAAEPASPGLPLSPNACRPVHWRRAAGLP